jgi:hypothetical protein
MVALSHTINNTIISHFLKYIKLGLGTTMILTIASNGSAKFQVICILFLLILCGSGRAVLVAFQSLTVTETSRTGCTQPFAPLLL